MSWTKNELQRIIAKHGLKTSTSGSNPKAFRAWKWGERAIAEYGPKITEKAFDVAALAHQEEYPASWCEAEVLQRAVEFVLNKPKNKIYSVAHVSGQINPEAERT